MGAKLRVQRITRAAPGPAASASHRPSSGLSGPSRPRPLFHVEALAMRGGWTVPRRRASLPPLPFREGSASPLVDRHVVPVRRAGVELAGAADLLLGVG